MMSSKKFSISETLSQAWGLFKQNWQFLLVLSVVYGILSQLPSSFLPTQPNPVFDPAMIQDYGDNMAIPAKPMSSFTPSYIFLSIAIAIFNAILTMGLLKISLNVVDKKKLEFSDLFSQYQYLVNYFVGSLIYGFIVFGGMLLLVIPGIVWAIKFQFYTYFIIDQGLGPIEALKKSAEITSGQKWNLFKLSFALFGVMLLGLLALVLGVFVSFPIIWIAMGLIYRKLDNSQLAEEDNSMMMASK